MARCRAESRAFMEKDEPRQSMRERSEIFQRDTESEVMKR